MEELKSVTQQERWLPYRRLCAKLVEGDKGLSSVPGKVERVAMLGSFTLDPIMDFLVVEAAAQSLRVIPYVGQYGQFQQEIIGEETAFWDFEADIAFLFCEFDKLVEKEEGLYRKDAAESAVQTVESLVQKYVARTNSPIAIATWFSHSQWPLNACTDTESAIVTKANSLLVSKFESDPQVNIVDLNGLLSYFGYKEAMSFSSWFMADIPFREGFLKALGKRCVSQIKATRGLTRKCLVLDCDATLWGGIVGEDGLEGIALGPSFPGREYVDFQAAVLELYHQGVILAINSKNNHEDVLEVLERHPHMLLRKHHFAAMRINWVEKPENMISLAKEINIGVDSMVFVDDNPVERALMRSTLPEVFTLDLPRDSCLYGRQLRECIEFSKLSITAEDRQRGRIYAAEKARRECKRSSESIESFLASLDMELCIRKAVESDVKRVAQLTQRTNQFNVTTRRYREKDIEEMLVDHTFSVYAGALRDKFGDSGMIAVVITEDGDPDVCTIDSFLISCRVLGRHIENAIIARVQADARTAGKTKVMARYVPSDKNKLVADLWNRLGFDEVQKEGDATVWSCDLRTHVPPDLSYLRIV